MRVKAVYLAVGVNLRGEKEVLGLSIAQTEGAKFWLQVVTELKNRGIQDIFIACVDGLKGFPEAIEAVYPHAAVQLCIVHMVRKSLNFVAWKMRAEVAADLKRIYTAKSAIRNHCLSFNIHRLMSNIQISGYKYKSATVNRL